MINIENLDANEIKVDENSYKNNLIYYIRYVAVKNINYVKIDSINPLYLITNKINGYVEESNKNKYLTLVPNDDNKDTLKKYEER